jgi:hypothetical protein
LLLALIWAGVFLHPLLPLFSPHPLLQSLGLFVLTQSLLLLQPTWAGPSKLLGAKLHAGLNSLSLLLFAAGIGFIESNKIINNGVHFHSVHGYLGVIAGVYLLAQGIFGVLMWAIPGVLGGEEAAKGLWRYHRWSGYVLFALLLLTVVSATQTPYNVNVLDIKLWSVLVAVALVVLGVYPRLSLTKLGLRGSS